MTQSTVLARKTKALSPSETATLARIEGQLRKGMESFILVGNLLLQVRDEKLYRENYSTFEAYLNERWEIGKSQGYNLIKAAKVVNALPDDAETPVSVRSALGIKSAPAGDRGASESTPEARNETPVEPDPVAIAKANGHMHPDAVVGVTHPEPDDEPEPQEVKEPTEAEWLDTLPARAKLSGLVRDRFDAEAVAYRKLADAKGRYRTECRKVTKPLTAEQNGHVGPWLSKHTLHFRIDDPADWQVCADCGGNGIHPMLKEQCPTCRGNAYHV